MNHFNRLAASLLALGLALAGAPGPARAGSRTAEVTVVAVHDDTDPGSKACFRRVVADVRDGDSEITTLSRAKFLKRLGATDAEGLLSWTTDQLRAGAGGTGGRDGVVAVDCRPAAGVLRLVMITETATVGPEGITLRYDAGGKVDRDQMDLAGLFISQMVWRDINY